MSNALDKAMATAAAMFAAQLISAREVDIELNNKPLVKLLTNDNWAMGYFIGCMHATIRVVPEEFSQEEELAAIAGSLMKFYGFSAEQVGLVVNLNRFAILQQDHNYIEGMRTGGKEMYNYFKKIPPAEGWDELFCTPRSLFVHLAPHRCKELDGILIPNTLFIGPFTDGLAINVLAVDLTENYLSGQGPRPSSNSGCAAVLFIVLLPSVLLLLL